MGSVMTNKQLDISYRKWGLVSFVMFLAIFAPYRYLSGGVGGEESYVLGFSLFIAITFFVRNILSDMLRSNIEVEGGDSKSVV